MGGAALSAPEPLQPTHELDAFNSGIAALDEWLKRRARHNEAEGASRTVVVCVRHRVVGYYSLAAAAIMRATATPKVRRNMPEPAPAVLLGRLAIDRSWQARGLGTDLLRDAVLRTIGAADLIGVRAILVHAISQDAKAFYEQRGFRVSPIDPMTLMITIDEARRMLEA